MNLPRWARIEENYTPSRDRDYFISRSLLRILTVVLALRRQGQARNFLPAPAVLAFLAGFLLLTILARTLVFLTSQLALELVVLCLLSGQRAASILGSALLAVLFSALLVAPALLLGSGGQIFLLPFKSLLTVMAAGIVTELLPWHELTAALRFFRLPQELVFILDTTLRNILLLGQMAEKLLMALKLRSVGHNRQKVRALSGVLGVLFLHAQHLSVQMYEAMVCRGFTGEYPQSQKPPAWGGSLLLLLALFLFCLLFACLEHGILGRI
ncbi:putative cobalt ABC transporter permease protein CbiQ (plasmid) [Selenomonas ruminantium subsp. lactilytica TAM6421]|uniref:Putative cobalt ABC transporter permease protein CbiQ n=1 Tax=Selenomonas ruminantium subsp. lactilytica (strain NBRC 103574 / TAM6421) TaxID=927704 RepID=I0GVM9_SELRL|nr:energy-coupling factor transporter transmembrane component T [Selenomonas ruminantium]BAL84816.1 putative cobalt ABC transporter permease protein CbiQ [Selenomonas ruminantium subsp. lactilytica TAM6421]